MKTFFLVFLCLVASVCAQGQLHSFTDLGTWGSYTYLTPTGINNDGDVVGTAYESAGRPVAFRHRAGSFTGVPSPGPAHSSWGNAINANSRIVGFCDRNSSLYHAFYQDVGGGLGIDFDGDVTRNTEAVAINDSNFVVGSVTSGGSAQAFLGHTGGWIFPLGSTLGSAFRAKGINNNFEIVGSGTWGGMTYNASTGASNYMGWYLGNWNNQASAINQTGEVAGKVGSIGYLYSGGTITYFGANVAEVKGINSAGDVVGTTTTGRGFLYRRASGAFIDLNSTLFASVGSTWTIVQATGINDSRVICAQARRLATMADGPGYGMYVYRAVKLRPFVLIPLPFPVVATP